MERIFKAFGLTALVCLFITACPAPAFAADAPTSTTQLVEHILAILGGLAAIAGALSAVLPKRWAVTNWLARFGHDFRGVRPVAPEREIEKASKRGGIPDLMNGSLVVLFAVLMSGCATLGKIDWPRKLECIPQNADLISLVGSALRDEDWRAQLEEMASDKDSGAVLCAVRQIVDDLESETASGPDTRKVVARGELLLAESGTSFE